MKYFLVFLILITWANLLFSQAGIYPDIEWERSLGGSDFDVGHVAHEIEDGGYIITGYSYSDNGDLVDNNGMTDFWVVKMDSARNIVWQNTYGGEWWDWSRDIIEVSDGYLTTGYTRSHDGDVGNNYGDWGLDYYELTSDLWVVKIDLSGSIVWEKNYGGEEGESAYKIINGVDGGNIICGGTSSYDQDVMGQHGESDGWVLKIDSVGNLLWQNAIGGTESDYFMEIKSTFDNGYVACGHAHSNNYDVSGNHGEGDAWIVKLNTAGEMQWQKCFGGSDNDYAYSVIQTADTGFLFVGMSSSSDGDVGGNFGNPDVWVVKLDSLGNIEWEENYGTEGWDFANSVIETIDGYVITGDIYADIWVFKIDFFGNIIWERVLGGVESDGANYIELTDDNGYLITGRSDSEDGDVTFNNGSSDYWLVKLEPECNHIQYFADSDNDGFGNILMDTFSCDLIYGYIPDSTDCDDNNILIFPGAVDNCNSIDDNCNGFIDEDAVFTNYYLDDDGDLFGDIVIDSSSCFILVGYVSDSTDCNDLNPMIFPGALDPCNAFDDNCNGLIDEDAIFTTYYLDSDVDGFGASEFDSVSCFIPIGYITDSTDCNDIDATINPLANEICNLLDDNCNG
ncbi:MAG: putative metal-binding motif-containing protein, partial [Chitinophagales bacterium]